MLVLKGLVGLRTVRLQLLRYYWLGHRLGLLWYWMEMNRDSSVIFEIARKYCILDSFVDYEGYSISSKGFLPTVVYTMVIWMKIHPFLSILVHWFIKCQCLLCHVWFAMSAMSCPLLLPSVFPSIKSPCDSALHIGWPKYWSFSFSVSPSNEYSGLISFRID